MGTEKDNKIEMISKINTNPGIRIMCEWCGAVIIGKRKRFCNRRCQNNYFANNQSRTTRNKRGKSMSGENHPLYGVGHTEETKRKMSNTKKGMYAGESNPFYGHTHTRESKELISKSRDNYKGKNHPWYGKTHTENSKLKMSETHTKLWKTYKYDPTKPQDSYRSKAIEYYGYRCEVCGVIEGMLVVHHINGDHYDDRIENLVVLCPSCHARAHYAVNEHARFTGGLNEEFRINLLNSRK